MELQGNINLSIIPYTTTIRESQGKGRKGGEKGVERIPNPGAAGSNPARGTIF